MCRARFTQEAEHVGSPATPAATSTTVQLRPAATSAIWPARRSSWVSSRIPCSTCSPTSWRPSTKPFSPAELAAPYHFSRSQGSSEPPRCNAASRCAARLPTPAAFRPTPAGRYHSIATQPECSSRISAAAVTTAGPSAPDPVDVTFQQWWAGQHAGNSGEARNLQVMRSFGFHLRIAIMTPISAYFGCFSCFPAHIPSSFDYSSVFTISARRSMGSDVSIGLGLCYSSKRGAGVDMCCMLCRVHCTLPIFIMQHARSPTQRRCSLWSLCGRPCLMSNRRRGASTRSVSS